MKHESKIIAEIGAVHLGSIERAKHLIFLAKECNADYVKFQKRNPEESVSEDIKHKPHPNQIFSYGKTYLEHRKALELSIDQHCELFDYSQKIGIKYSCSVWDMTSAEQIAKLNPEYIKIPSACNRNNQIIDYLYHNYCGDIHISTGMSSHQEIDKIVEMIFSKDPKRFVIYHCTSIYPCPFDKIYLSDISSFAELKKMGLRVGFSNHGFGIALDVASMILGADFIERHFIDDRTIRHSDAAASLEPEGLRKLCRDIKNVGRAMRNSPSEMDELELIERKKLSKE